MIGRKKTDTCHYVLEVVSTYFFVKISSGFRVDFFTRRGSDAGIVTDERGKIRRNRLSERRSQACLDYPERQRLPERKRWRKIDKENDWFQNYMYFLSFANK